MKGQRWGRRYDFVLAEEDLSALRWREMPETCALDIAAKGGVTLEEIGQCFGVTREMIRQIEMKALGHLRGVTPEGLRELLTEDPIHHRVRPSLGECFVNGEGSRHLSLPSCPPKERKPAPSEPIELLEITEERLRDLDEVLDEEEPQDGPKTETPKARQEKTLADHPKESLADNALPDHAVLERESEPAKEEAPPEGSVATPAEASNPTPEKAPEEEAPVLPILEALKPKDLPPARRDGRPALLKTEPRPKPRKDVTMQTPTLTQTEALSLLRLLLDPELRPLVTALARAGGLLDAGERAEQAPISLVPTPAPLPAKRAKAQREEATPAPDLVSRIRKLVCDSWGIREKDFLYKGNVLPRWVAWWLHFHLVKMSQSQVAAAWGRKQDIISHAFSKLRKKLKEEPDFKARVDGLLSELQAASAQAAE